MGRPRRCIFCGGSRLTDEHVIPAWVADCLPGEGPYRYRRDPGGEWESEIMNQTVAHACKGCNTGWMSRLEGRAKPLLCRSMRGYTPHTWTRKEQRTVATWMFKTAIMSDLTIAGDSRVPREHYRFLFKNLHPPDRVRVWAAAFSYHEQPEDFRGSWMHAAHLRVRGPISGYTADGYLATINVGHVAFQVLGYTGIEKVEWTGPPIDGVPASAYEIPVWPQAGGPVTWPPPVGFDEPHLGAYAARWAP